MTTQTSDISDELSLVMTDALLELQRLVEFDRSEKHDLLEVVRLFLLGVISTAVDLVEIKASGSTLFLYADIEAAAKLGGLKAIQKIQSVNGAISYSVSNIRSDDASTAMNYLGQKLSETLFKSIHELPIALRTPEMLLRGVEALLANLLNQKFDNSHQILDSLCEHVHMALDDLKNRKH